MEFIIEFNNKLIKRMFFYKTFSKETFNYKKFSSKKSLINKIILQGNFNKRVTNKKKDILKKNIILRLLTNNLSKEIFNKKKSLNIKKGMITNVENVIPTKYLDFFLSKWFFSFNPFFQENEINSINGPKSIKKRFESFKTIRLLNSRLISSSFFNFELSLKISFDEKNSSEIFNKNYEC